jgi:hypothetical protein
MEIGACDAGLGAVFVQKGQDIAFLSRALSDKHKYLSIYEKEFLALILVVDWWRTYLQRQEFTIKIDHRSLSYLEDQHWHSELQKKAIIVRTWNEQES